MKNMPLTCSGEVHDSPAHDLNVVEGEQGQNLQKQKENRWPHRPIMQSLPSKCIYCMLLYSQHDMHSKTMTVHRVRWDFMLTLKPWIQSNRLWCIINTQSITHYYILILRFWLLSFYFFFYFYIFSFNINNFVLCFVILSSFNLFFISDLVVLVFQLQLFQFVSSLFEHVMQYF